MKLLESAKANPGWAAAIAIVVGAVGFFAGMDRITWYWQSHATAYAAKQESDALKSNFDQYIAQQQEEAKLEKQRIELQQEYNERLLDLQQRQQQQVPNTAPMPSAPPPMQRFWDDQQEWYYCDDGQQMWWADSEGRCE